jgi:hypothetical protein
MFTSLRCGDQALFLTGLLVWASAAGCSKRNAEPPATTDGASATADSAATPGIDTAAPAPAPAESTAAKGSSVTPSSSQAEKPKPLPKPSIDPGRKPAKRLGDTAAPAKSPGDTASAAPSAAPAAPGSGQGQVLQYDAATNTVTFELIAGPFNFNGYTNGGATLTLPSKANVVITFTNKDGTPHSAEVISGEGPIPNAAGDPAIPRAYTTKVLEGLPQEATDVMRFPVPESGKYRIFCGVPGHGLSGMWIWMVVDPAAKTPSFGPTKK